LYRVTLIQGDGIGPEVTEAARSILDATGVDLKWEVVSAGETAWQECGDPLPGAVLDSIRETGVALKGPTTTPVGSGFRSVNVAIRQALDLYACIRPIRQLAGVCTRYEKVDLVIFRENTEDLYAGVEHLVGDGAAEAIKITTEKACRRIVRSAFEYAVRYGRRKVTAVHKANILKLTDGMFLRVARAVAAGYPEIEFEDLIVDNACMQLVQRPQEYDILVMNNLYGDIISDLGAGLVGGLGVVPGANIGDETAVFEPAHGSAPQIAGKGTANPVAMVLSGAMLLDYLGEKEAARMVLEAVEAVLGGGVLTPDLGGEATTREMTEAIIRGINRPPLK